MTDRPEFSAPIIRVGHKPARLAVVALREWLASKRVWWVEGDRSEIWPEGEDPNDMWCVEMFANELEKANNL